MHARNRSIGHVTTINETDAIHQSRDHEHASVNAMNDLPLLSIAEFFVLVSVVDMARFSIFEMGCCRTDYLGVFVLGIRVGNLGFCHGIAGSELNLMAKYGSATVLFYTARQAQQPQCVPRLGT